MLSNEDYDEAIVVENVKAVHRTNKKTVLKTIKPFRDKAPVAEPRVVESDLQEQLSMKAIKSEERKLAHVALKNKLAHKESL